MDDDDDDDFVAFQDSSQPMTSQLALVARQPSVAKQPLVARQPAAAAAAANHNVHAARHVRSLTHCPVILLRLFLLVLQQLQLFTHMCLCHQAV